LNTSFLFLNTNFGYYSVNRFIDICLTALLLAKLYRKQLAKVKVVGTLSEWFPVKKGVRQGCVLSPYLFNILSSDEGDWVDFKVDYKLEGE